MNIELGGWAPPTANEWSTVNPLEQPGWDSLLGTHPASTFFHSSAWARVLHETYGHEPFYLCRVLDGKIQGLLPFMEISRPWMGVHAVSLPFTDACELLLGPETSRYNPYELAIRYGVQRGWKFFECRGGDCQSGGALPSLSFYGHLIRLDPSTDALFAGLKASVRRCIKRAVRSNILVEFSQSTDAMRSFYQLHCSTRRRHGLPPQPIRFFESIASNVLAKDHGVVVSALLNRKPIAAAVFFYHGRKALFKFGGSNYSFQRLRPNDLVMWEAIKWCKERGFELLHLGRTSLMNPGLRRFKRGFGAQEEEIVYCKYDFRKRAFIKGVDYSEGIANKVFRWLPVSVLRLSGSLLYQHMG